MFFFPWPFANLIPRADAYAHVLFQLAGVLLLVNAVRLCMFLVGAALSEQMIRLVAWRPYGTTCVLQLLVGLTLLYLPGRFLPGGRLAAAASPGRNHLIDLADEA